MSFAPHKFTVQDDTGAIVPGAQVQVIRTADGSPAVLFSDNGVTGLSNPFNADITTAEAEFFAAPDRYTITVTGAANSQEQTIDLIDTRQNLTFTSRANAVAWIAGGGSAPDGAIMWVGVPSVSTLAFVAVSGNTTTPNMGGWVPYGEPEPQHYGVAANGTDQTAGMQAWMDYAFDTGRGAINIPGVYGILDRLGHSLNNDVDITVAGGVTIAALTGFTANRDMIQVTTGSGSGHTFKWVGGSYDCELQPSSLAGQSNDIFSLNALNHSGAQIHLDRTYAGEDYRTGGGDSHIFAAGDNLDLSIGHAQGAVDAAIYASADSTDSTIGANCQIHLNAYKCNTGSIVKRAYETINSKVYAEDCLNGAGVSTAEVGGVLVKSNDGGFLDVTTRRCQRSAYVQAGDNMNVRVNAIDIGLSLTGGTPVLSTAAKALYISGASGVKGEVNAQGVNAACTVTGNFVAVELDERTIDTGTFQAVDNMVSILARDVGRAVLEQNSAARNRFVINEEGNNSVPVLATGSGSYIDNFVDGRQLVSHGAVPTNFTTGAVRERSSGAANFIETTQSTVGYQHLVKNLTGGIEARLQYTISSNTWTLRGDGDTTLFYVNAAGPRAPNYSVASLPTAGRLEGNFVYATNGRKNGEGAAAGSGAMVFWDGSNWIAFDSGQPVEA